MERQSSFDRERFGQPRLRNLDEAFPSGDSLDQQRCDVDDLLQAADHIFDSMNGLQAHQYLEQNLQTGGQ
jgi:hypothetical protein